MDDASWKDTFRRAAGGNRAAFGDLCGPTFRARTRLAAFVQLPPALRHRIDVEDLVQETMDCAWRDLSTLQDTTPDGFWRWLRGVVQHRVQDAVRRETRIRRDVRRDIPSDGAGESRFGTAAHADPLQRAANHELYCRVAAVLDQLSESYRQVILLRIIESCPAREVAARLGKTEENIAVTLHRALIRFRESLRQEGVDTTLFRPLH